MPNINAYARTEEGEAVHVIPQLRVSSMDCLTQGFNFVVTLNEFTFGFQSVSGLSISKAVTYISEGGVNDHQLMVGAPSNDSPTLTFRRGILVRTPELLDRAARAAAASTPNNIARKALLLAAASVDPQQALEVGPAVGIIQVYSRERHLKALYSFLSLGVTNWRSDDLDAGNGSIICEEFTVAHTGLVRHPLTAPFMQTINAIGSADDDIRALQNSTYEIDKAKEQAERKKRIDDIKKKHEEELRLEREKRKEEKELEKEKEKLSELKKQLEENG